jgi:pimeloyl-ACP methyl ester carboxylesterase
LHLRRENQESKLDYFRMVYQLRQTAHTVDEVIAVLSERNPAASLEDLRPFAQSLAWLDPNYLTAITWGNERETARNVDFEAHIRGIACPVLMMQADRTLNGALAQEDLDFFMAHAHNAHLVTFPGAGHSIHIDQPAEFLQAFDDFTASILVD